MTALSSLREEELDGLADALATGRLVAPLSGFALQRVVGRAPSAELVEAVSTLVEACNVAGAAAALRLLADQRRALTGSRLAPELVWTGPDAVQSIRDTAVVVRELFERARSEVLLSGFVIVRGEAVFGELATRMDAEPGLRVRLFLNVPLRPPATADESVNQFAREFRSGQWPGQRLPEVYYDPRALEGEARNRAVLHAKCVVVDRQTAFVTSANFTPHAQRRNIELGVLLESATLARQIDEQFEQLVTSGQVHRLPGT